jgi:hypothetical protein
MELETKIKRMKKFKKDLSGLAFNVTVKGDQATVKFRKKFVLVKCPDKATADEMAKVLNGSLYFHANRVNTIVDLLSKHCEQICMFDSDNKLIQEGEADNGTPEAIGNS